MRERLRAFFQYPAVDAVVAVLILLSVAVVVAESIYREGLLGYDLVLVGDALTMFFVVELSLRLLAAASGRAFLREYWLDVLSVLPLLRVFRVMRVLRLLRLGRILNRRLRKFTSIFAEGLMEYAFVVLLMAVFVLSGTLGIMYAEAGNPAFATFHQCFWWSIHSCMAAQASDTMPTTDLGHGILVALVVGGVTIVALVTGFFAAFMAQRLRLTMEGKVMELEELSKHIIVCGWNRAGRLLVESLQGDQNMRSTPIVIIAEREREPILDPNLVRPEMIYFVNADYTQVAVLKRCNVATASMAILLADRSRNLNDQDRDARTVLAAMVIEKLNREIFTVVELLNRDNETHLRMAGVEDIIVGDEYAGSLIATAARARGGVVPMMNEIFNMQQGNSLFKVPMPDSWDGRTAGEVHCQLKKERNAILMSFERTVDGKSETITNPAPDVPLRKGDNLVLVAPGPLKLA